MLDPELRAVMARLDTLERQTLPSFEARLRYLESLARAEATDEEVKLWDPGDTGNLAPPTGGEGKATGGAPGPARG